jgi:hypothetical protein
MGIKIRMPASGYGVQSFDHLEFLKISIPALDPKGGLLI